MLLEFQTTGANYLYQFRERLKAMSLALTDEQRDAQGRAMIVNRLLIGNGTQLRADKAINVEIQTRGAGLTFVGGKRMQIVQPITIELVYLDDLIANGDAPSSVQAIPIWVVLDVALRVIGGVAFLEIAYDSVTGFLPPDVLDAMDARLRVLIPKQSSPLDLSSVQNMLKGLQVVNAGIACKPGAGGPGNVAMRIELGSADSGGEAWARFFRGEYDDLVGTPGQRPIAPAAAPERWAMFLDKALLEQFVTNMLLDAFTDSKDLKLRSDISVRWSNPGGEARIDASFKAIAIDACDLEPFGKYDIRLDVQIPIVLSVPGDNVLRQHLKVNYWKNDIDTAACVVGMSVFFPITGVELMSKNKLKWWQYLLLVVVVPLRFIMITIAANDKKLDPPTPTTKKVADDEFEADQPFTAAPLVLLNYRGLSSGLVLLGRQPTVPDTCPPRIDAGHCGFELKAPHISCSQVADSDEQQLQHHITGNVHMAAVARAENVGEQGCQSPNRVRLQNWGWRFLDDTLAKKLQILVIDDEYTDLSVLEIRSQIPGADYFADPRPVQLLLKTNGGARVFSYAFAEPTQTEINKLALDAAIEAVGRCKQLVDPWWHHYHGFNPRWHVDPPFRVSPADRQVWVFTFAGLLPGDTMTASVGEQRLMSARANQLGRATLSVVTSGTQPPEVTLEYRPANPLAELPRGQMFMSQTTLTPIADIELSAAIEQLHVRDRSDGRTLYAIHGDGFSVVDISVPTSPMIMADHRRDDLRGAAFDGDSLVLFDRARPARFEMMDSLPRRDPCEQSASAVVRALMSGQDHYVVRERAVDVYDRNLCQVRHVDLDRAAVTATMLGAYLVIGGDAGLTILDPTQPEPVLRRFEMAAVETVSTPQFGAPSDSILVRSSQGIGLYEVPADLSQTQQLVLLADVLADPWFDRLATFGSHVATVSASKISISAIVGRVRWCSV